MLWSSNTESILNYSAAKVGVKGKKAKEDEEAVSLSVRGWGDQAHIQDVYTKKKTVMMGWGKIHGSITYDSPPYPLQGTRKNVDEASGGTGMEMKDWYEDIIL